MPYGGGSYEMLHGPIHYKSSLHGLLDRIQSLGLELVEIRRLPAAPDELDELAAESESPP